MREGKRIVSSASLVAAIAAMSFIGATQAAITVDGVLDAAYGGPLATQTNNTGFGDSLVPDGQSTTGSELDAAYGTKDNTYLYLFLAGNFENNGNHVNIFIADGSAGGQSVLNANSSSGNLSAVNGLTFPSGFKPTLAIDGNDFANNFYFDSYGLAAGSANYIGSVGVGGGNNSGALSGGILVGINNTNIAGVNGTGGAANPVAADAVFTGLELAIPLSTLGPGPYQVLADINGGGDNYLSNQFLGGLPGGSGNLGSPNSVNLSGQVSPFVISVPEPTGLVLLGTGVLMLGRRKSTRN